MRASNNFKPIKTGNGNECEIEYFLVVSFNSICMYLLRVTAGMTKTELLEGADRQYYF